MCSLCESSAFVGRAGFDTVTSHIFSQGVLAALTFVAGWNTHAGARLESGLSLCSLAITTQIWGWILSFWSRIPEGLGFSSVHFKCVLSHLPALVPLTQGSSAEARGSHAHFSEMPETDDQAASGLPPVLPPAVASPNLLRCSFRSDPLVHHRTLFLG